MFSFTHRVFDNRCVQVMTNYSLIGLRITVGTYKLIGLATIIQATIIQADMGPNIIMVRNNCTGNIQILMSETAIKGRQQLTKPDIGCETDIKPIALTAPGVTFR